MSEANDRMLNRLAGNGPPVFSGRKVGGRRVKWKDVAGLSAGVQKKRKKRQKKRERDAEAYDMTEELME